VGCGDGHAVDPGGAEPLRCLPARAYVLYAPLTASWIKCSRRELCVVTLLDRAICFYFNLAAGGVSLF
jgi:hypothetical protein